MLDSTEIVSIGMNNTWYRGNMIQVVFPSIGCQKKGKCSMCNFGADERNCTLPEALSILERALEWSAERKCAKGELYEPVTLLLGTYGSILDEKEFDCIEGIFEYLNRQTDIPKITNIILESHYTTVDIDRLIKLRDILDPIDGVIPTVSIEMGFESYDYRNRDYKLNKHIDAVALGNLAQKLQQNNFRTIANILLGIPGLSPTDQITDCINSVKWAYYHHFDEMCIFPLNIWEGSEVWEAYQNGQYTRPTYYQLFNVLKCCEEYIDKISVSWYGDRQYSNTWWNPNCVIIPPDGGPIEGFKWVEAVNTFLRLNTKESRMAFVRMVLNIKETVTPILETDKPNKNGRTYDLGSVLGLLLKEAHIE